MTIQERVAVLETKIDDVKERVEHNCNLNQERFDSIEEKLDAFIKAANENYAEKSEVEEIKKDLRTNKNRVWGVLTAVATGIIGLLIYLVKIHLK